MRYVEVKDGKVVNVAVVSPDDVPTFMGEWFPCPDEVGPGWGYANETGEWIEPEAPVEVIPDLTPRQFNWMLAKFDYLDRMEATKAFLKTANPDLFADIYADTVGAKKFRFDRTMALIGDPAIADQIEGYDAIEEDTLKGQWMQAAAK